MKNALIFVLFLLPIALFAGPVEGAVQAQGANLLKNPGFEAPFPADNNGGAHDWVRWHRESSEDQFGDCTNGYHKRPRWGQATDFVYEGGTSQYIGNNWDTWSAGMWQNVAVTPGSTYRFTFWARGRGSMEPAPDPSFTGLNMGLRAGIDPNGSGLWSDGDIVWGAAGNAHDQWVQFSVEATATDNTVTVFTWADWGVPGVNQCYKFLDTYFDSASLVEVGPPPTNTPPPPPPPPPATNTPLPTATPAETLTPSPVPTATASPTATPLPGGRVCVNAFDDPNANGVQDESEGFMGGVTFTVASTEAFVGQGVSRGTSEAVCFEGIAPGSYQIEQITPGRLEMTTAAKTTLVIAAGDDIGLNFGSRLRPADIATSTTTGPDTVSSANELPTPLPETAAGDTSETRSGTILGFALVALGAVLLGGLLFMVLRRQTV